MPIFLPAVGISGIKSQGDLERYLAVFNSDDYAEYTKYYHADFKVCHAFIFRGPWFYVFQRVRRDADTVDTMIGD
jgi:hypothetical protein